MSEISDREKHRRKTGNGNLMPPWKKGQSGNPKGRPKRKTIFELIHDKLGEKGIDPRTGTEKENREILAELLFDRLIIELMDRKSKLDGFKEVFDRLTPKIKEALLRGDKDAPLEIQITSEDDNWREKLEQRSLKAS